MEICTVKSTLFRALVRSVSGVVDRKFPHANKHIHGFIHHGLNSLNHIVTVVAWQLESQAFFHTVQESGRGCLPNAHRAIALYVEWPAQDRALHLGDRCVRS